MKCAMCGRDIKGMDYIRVNVSNQDGIYVHSVPCKWYASEEHVKNGT
jgi:hypothetical protein